MSASGEPPKKRSRKCVPSDYVMEDHDRVIVAGKRKFLVNSKVLSFQSEYFRILFQSDFKEKQQEIIEFKEINEKSFEQFLNVMDSPEEFIATKGKLIDLIATMAYFNATEPLEQILKDSNNFNKLPNEDLLELARTFGIPLILELVEDWYLVRFDVSHLAKKHQQLQLSFDYGMIRLETKLLDYFKAGYELEEIMERILKDDSDIGKKVFQKMKTVIFEEFAKGETYIMHMFTSAMSETQFDSINDEAEDLILNEIKSKRDFEQVGKFFYLTTWQMKKLEKVKAFLTEQFSRLFPDCLNTVRFNMIGQAQKCEMNNFLTFGIDHLIKVFPLVPDWHAIHIAISYNLKPLKDFLYVYLRDNFANLSEESKKEIENRWNVKDLINIILKL